MISIGYSKTILQCLLAGGALCFAFSLPAVAQVKSTETVEHGTATKQVKIERGEVVYVSGNDLVVKMEDGSLRDFFNVPDSTTVAGQGLARLTAQLCRFDVGGRHEPVLQDPQGAKIHNQWE